MSIKLRQDFIDYYRENGHRFLPPSKVYNDDKSLLFVNAGMNQLKKVFLGEEETKSDKLVNYQICIRAGGKHNDFDDVGYDETHLTSFEMLGNWSINSYDKRTAITLAFKCLTEKFHLDPKYLYATYFQGTDDIPCDTESKNIWESLLDPTHVVKGNYDDNFWLMADDGPCGVCTEIHYDMDKSEASVAEKVNVDERVVEIWNIVFISYNKKGDTYEDLGKLFVDTGMGMERICMILQKEESVYDTDCFRYLFGYAQALTGAHFYKDDDISVHVMAAYKIFADHMRTTVNALFDGVEFDGHGKGQVLRKIFRRALTHTYIYLNNGVFEPLMIKDAVRGMITDILCYFLKAKHDADDIQSKLIAEEKLALGTWFQTKKRYNKLIKKKTSQEDIEKTLKMSGVTKVIIDNLHRLEFHMNHDK